MLLIRWLNTKTKLKMLVEENFKKYAEEFAKEMIPKLREVAKGFAPTIGYEIEEKANTINLKIYGDEHILTLVYGRGPTKNTGRTGASTLRANILEWVKKHNISANIEGSKTFSDQSLAYAIASKIHSSGTKLYRDIQAGQQPVNMFDEILNETRLKEFEAKVTNDTFYLLLYEIEKK